MLFNKRNSIFFKFYHFVIKTIDNCNLTMLKHELLEESIMGNSLDIPYETAHNIAEKQYNYQKELMEYLEERGLL